MGCKTQGFGSLLGAGVLGDGLCSFAHGVLGEFTWQEETNSGLDFPTGDGGLLVVVCKTGCLGCYSLENIVDKAVHDRHSLAGDTSVGVDLLQNFVDVNAVAFLPPPLPLLVASSLRFGLGGRLLTTLR